MKLPFFAKMGKIALSVIFELEEEGCNGFEKAYLTVFGLGKLQTIYLFIFVFRL